MQSPCSISQGVLWTPPAMLPAAYFFTTKAGVLLWLLPARRNYMNKDEKQLAQQIGRICSEVRTAQSRTQDHVADCIGINAQYYGRIERGGALPSVPVLVAIAKTLSVRIDELFGWEEIPRARPVRQSQPEEERLRRLERRLRRASPTTRRVVLRFLAGIERVLMKPKAANETPSRLRAAKKPKC